MRQKGGGRDWGSTGEVRMDNFGAQKGAAGGVLAGRHDSQLGGGAAGVVASLRQPCHRALVCGRRAVHRMNLKASLPYRLPIHPACMHAFSISGPWNPIETYICSMLSRQGCIRQALLWLTCEKPVRLPVCLGDGAGGLTPIH